MQCYTQPNEPIRNVHLTYLKLKYMHPLSFKQTDENAKFTHMSPNYGFDRINSCIPDWVLRQIDCLILHTTYQVWPKNVIRLPKIVDNIFHLIELKEPHTLMNHYRLSQQSQPRLLFVASLVMRITRLFGCEACVVNLHASSNVPNIRSYACVDSPCN